MGFVDLATQLALDQQAVRGQRAWGTSLLRVRSTGGNHLNYVVVFLWRKWVKYMKTRQYLSLGTEDEIL